MKPTIVLDTMGTTVMECAEELNAAFFKYGTQFQKEDGSSYTSYELLELRKIYEKDPKDPRFIVPANHGKFQVVQRGFVVPEFFPDVRRAFEKYIASGYDITIFGKGSHVGTKTATKVLKDGDLVEIDTTTGIVRKI